MAGGLIMRGDARFSLNGKTILHATNFSLEMSRDLKERETKDTQGKEQSKSTKSWTGSVDALATYGDDGATQSDFFALFDHYNDDTDTPLDVEFVQASPEAPTHKLQGQAIITTLSLNGTVGEDGTINMAVTGSGIISKVAV